MPDPDKFRMLRKVGYQIPRTCGFCKHAQMKGFPGYGWGTCAVHQYQHGKHTGGPRQMSIYHAGSCDTFELNPATLAVLGSFREFFEET